jgi:hypothetical protein
VKGDVNRAMPETISDRQVHPEVSANFDTGAVHLELPFVDENDPTLRARVVLEIPDLGEAEAFAYRILDAVAEIAVVHQRVQERAAKPAVRGARAERTCCAGDAAGNHDASCEARR